ncbi:hypothetical protein AALD22_07430 [Lachnospiraceae bacterium 56-18]|jgi:hypothetical protein|uniref:hypothetical protein n=1 Tax=Sporofaciens sp. JLR.KK001 TaxID=3112621 RepID=UPI002FF1CBAB
MKIFEEFTKESKRSTRTVRLWIKNGLVNGAAFIDDNYRIFGLARLPYTRASSRNAASIRKGIVVSCKRQLSVNAKIFKGVSEYEFNVYLDQVIALEFVEKRVVDEVTYYYATPKAEDLTETQVYQVAKGLAEASAGAVTEKMFAVPG